MPKSRRAAAGASILLIAVLELTAVAQDKSTGRHWVTAWSTAVQGPPPVAGSPPSSLFENQTIRMIVRPTIGGERVRVRLSNAFGTAALSIGAVHIALAAQGDRIITESDRALTFGGRPSLVLPRGAPMLSDPVDLKVASFNEIAVSIYLPEKTSASTVHFWAQHETYISGPGDFTAKPDIPNATTKLSWYWLADVEVWAPNETAATVAFGDSITDGVGAKQGDYADWPDLLAKRLDGHRGGSKVAVVNEGIGGNRILHYGTGASALARFDRDVLGQPGVANIILLEGINDIGYPHIKPRTPKGTTLQELPFVHELVTAQDLIVGMREIIERAHGHGIRVFGATLTPYQGADYYSADGEATRQEVNRWIRTSGAFDGVFDFDAAVRDPNRPSQFREEFQSGDHLHPSSAGYKAMADAVDLSILTSTTHR